MGDAPRVAHTIPGFIRKDSSLTFPLYALNAQYFLRLCYKIGLFSFDRFKVPDGNNY
jgi:hypothetical protein